jgi:hypothetical protein
MHRAGTAVTQTASKVLGGNGAAAIGQAAGPATTTGPYYRPLSPSSPGAVVGIFERHRTGDAWPRVAIRFTRAGANQACWTAQATVWRSAKERHVETFDVCNSPVAFTDSLGRNQYMTAPEDAVGGGQGTLQFSIAQNIEGISHADTAPGDVRDDGPLPPHMLFYLGQETQSGVFAHQYHEILIRLMWITGWLDHANPVLNNNSGKTLWVIGFNQGAATHD